MGNGGRPSLNRGRGSQDTGNGGHGNNSVFAGNRLTRQDYMEGLKKFPNAKGPPWFPLSPLLSSSFSLSPLLSFFFSQPFHRAGIPAFSKGSWTRKTSLPHHLLFPWFCFVYLCSSSCSCFFRCGGVGGGG